EGGPLRVPEVSLSGAGRQRAQETRYNGRERLGPVPSRGVLYERDVPPRCARREGHVDRPRLRDGPRPLVRAAEADPPVRLLALLRVPDLSHRAHGRARDPTPGGAPVGDRRGLSPAPACPRGGGF